MKKLLLTIFTLAVLSISADQAEFCHGFSEGYKSVKGSIIIVPVCPVAPVTPVGSTDFREGLRAGIAAAHAAY